MVSHPDPVPEPWVSKKQIAAHFGVSTTTIDNWCRTRGMPYRDDGRRRFRISSVDAWHRNESAASMARHRIATATNLPISTVGELVSEVAAAVDSRADVSPAHIAGVIRPVMIDLWAEALEVTASALVDAANRARAALDENVA